MWADGKIKIFGQTFNLVNLWEGIECGKIDWGEYGFLCCRLKDCIAGCVRCANPQKGPAGKQNIGLRMLGLVSCKLVC